MTNSSLASRGPLSGPFFAVNVVWAMYLLDDLGKIIALTKAMKDAEAKNDYATLTVLAHDINVFDKNLEDTKLFNSTIVGQA